jgi:hypothetical protein
MRTLEDGKPTARARTEVAAKEELFRQYEADKLVQEMRTLIEKRGLRVDLVPQEGGAPLGEAFQSAGCSSCTLCPCMICW